MSKPITLFSGYSQKENRVTNYCLLVMKMLYEENPKYLGEVLSGVINENISDHVGVSFRQQERKKSSVPDGLIIQPALTIFIETKNYDWFYDTQLENHLNALDDEQPGMKVLLALGKFDYPDQARFEPIQKLCEKQYKNSVAFAAVSFEDLVEAMQIPTLPKNLSDAISDFRSFLDEEDLLPSWKWLLDVVNCAGFPEEVLDGNAYMCPATGGSYSHIRCRYLGMYRQKRVDRIALIEAVVDVDLAGSSRLKWSNVDRPDGSLVRLAERKVREFRPNDGPTRVFALGELFETDFKKDTPGGMVASKRYYDVSELRVDGARELAEALRGRTWSDFSNKFWAESAGIVGGSTR